MREPRPPRADAPLPARVLHAAGERWPWLRPLLPVSVLAVSWSSCLAGEGPLVAFLGDSLTSGWRLREDEAWPARLARRLAEKGRPIRALNAGRSGDTVAQGAARLSDVLALRPDVLVVALGINDGLRGLPLRPVESALRGIVVAAGEVGSRVLLVGIRLPPGAGGPEGEERSRLFGEIHPRLAAEHHLPLVPDLLEGVSGDPALLFPDRLHPNAAGHARLAETVRPHLESLLADGG